MASSMENELGRALLDQIKSRIRELVQSRAASGKRHYFLSQLGNDLGADKSALERVSGKKLAQFIRDEFDFPVRVTGEHSNVFYIELSTDAAPVLGSVSRYNRRFWAAFAKPLEENERRVINIETCQFGSPNDVADSGGGVFEISRDYLVAADAPERDKKITEQVGRWLSDQGLDSERFLLRKKLAPGPERTALDMLLNSLDGDQLRRVNLPLDIVRALASRRLG